MNRTETLKLLEAEISRRGGQSATSKQLGVSQARVSAGLKQEILPEILLNMIGKKKVVSYD